LIRETFLGVANSYMVVYRGNAFTPINQIHFPAQRRPDLVSRSYGMLTWHWTCRYYLQGWYN